MTNKFIARGDYRPDVDGLRAVAIIAVLAFHAFPSLLPGGFAGVDVFFVISGFLISRIIFKGLSDGSFSFFNFYLHRINRIFPALILVLLTCYVLGWCALLPDEFKQLGRHMAAGAGFVVNFVLLNEAGYFDTVSDLKPLLHLWSLAIEEQFYFLYPFFVWFVWRFKREFFWPLVVLAVISFGINIVSVTQSPVLAYFSPQTRFWELLAGGVLAVVCMEENAASQDVKKFRDSASMFGLLLILGSFFLLDKSSSFPGWWALMPVLGACLLIWAGPSAFVNRKLLSIRGMVFVGLISYPLYLWHWPVLSFLHITESVAPSYALVASAVVLCLLLAWLTYRMVELPLRQHVTTPFKAPVLTIFLFLIGFVGYNAFERDGLAFRFKTAASNDDLLDARNRCFDNYPQLKVLSHCSVTSYADPEIALIGDSHSDHLFPGLSAYSGIHLVNFGHHTCPPFYNAERRRKDIVDGGCKLEMGLALSTAEKAPFIKTVILSTMGPYYMYGDRKGGGPGVSVKLSGHEEVHDGVQIFNLGLREALQRLTSAGKRVVLMTDVPELGFDARECLGRPLSITNRVKDICAVPRLEHELRTREYRQIMTAAAKDFPGVVLFDTEKFFCDDKWCWAKINGELLYRDGDHLTREGSNLVARELVKTLIEIGSLKE